MFLEKNTKTLLICLGAVVILVSGYFAFKYWYFQPRAEKAAAAMFVAEQMFMEEDYLTALEGDGNNAGFLEVADRYGCSRPARMASHYAGVCYMKLGDTDNALIYLKKYKTAKGAPAVLINAQNFGLQGDIYVQRGKYRKAVDLYQKAVKASDNVLTTPYYLKKLGLVYQHLGENEMARATFRHIVDEYGSSLEAREIEKFIGILEQQ